jgi:hypothetical protein
VESVWDETVRLENESQLVKLIVIDSLESFAGSDDSRSLNGTLGYQLANIAATTCAAVVCLTSTDEPRIGKSQQSRRSYMPVIEKLARSIWRIERDRREPERRRLIPVKTNLCEIQAIPSCTIKDGTVEWKTEPAASTWKGELDRAMEWVQDVLNGKTLLSKDLFQRALKHDLGEVTLRRALKQLGCVTAKQTGSGKWTWSLGENDSRSAIEQQPVNGQSDGSASAACGSLVASDQCHSADEADSLAAAGAVEVDSSEDLAEEENNLIKTC